MGKLVVSEKNREANEEVAKATVTKLMVMNNPKWRQQVVLADGIIADMPKIMPEHLLSYILLPL